MTWRVISIRVRLSLACVLLLAASGCGGGSDELAAAVKDGSETKSETNAKSAKPGTLASDEETRRSNGEQPSGDDTVAVTIPLDQIWALHMPGTKSILQLDPDGDYNSLTSLPSDEIVKRWKNSVLRQIAEALSADTPGSDWPKEGQTAKPGFAVGGTGVDALREAYDVFVNHKPVQDSFPKGSALSLVFFAYAMGSYEDIQSVERRGNSIEIQYRLVGPRERGFAVELALIPIGPLPAGNYQVSMVRLPTGRELLDGTRVPMIETEWRKKREKEFAERFVCKSFNFSVVAVDQ